MTNPNASEIYHLVKERGLKIGDVEDQAGVSIGYLSRLNKDDNKSTPGIEFLLAVAQVLNVSLERLDNGMLRDFYK